jgi:hypothetical protein
MLAVALKNAGDYLGLGSATLVPGLCRIQVRSIASQKGDVDGVEAAGCPGPGDIELPKAE